MSTTDAESSDRRESDLLARLRASEDAGHLEEVPPLCELLVVFYEEQERFECIPDVYRRVLTTARKP